MLHSYRHRLGYAPSYPPYDQVEQKLAAQPAITVPAVTLDGLADSNFPATDGSTSARYFTGPRVHHQVQGAGHNLPQEAPDASPAGPGTGTSSITVRRSVRLLTHELGRDSRDAAHLDEVLSNQADVLAFHLRNASYLLN